MIYIKEAEKISDFLKIIRANNAVLYFEDIRVLLNVLNKLADKGNTILVIEHNLDIIKSADYIIDMGPEGGVGGGEILCAGTPKDICETYSTYTTKYLKEEI